MENFAYFTSSKGLLKSCAKHNLAPKSSSTAIDINILDGLKSHDSIYVCSDALNEFVQHHLPRIDTEFRLVSGDSDLTIDEAQIHQNMLWKILESPYLLSWHAQNLAFKHHKLFAIPIGNDYHTMSEHAGLWSLSTASAISQETKLLEIYKNSPSFEHRFVAGYCNWHFAIDRGDRNECFLNIDKSIAFFEQQKIPRDSTWRRQSEFMFVISPEGAGMDCHRTWEALLLGSIPIVKSSPLNSLFKDLPVLIINDWQDINSQNLIDFASQCIHKKFDFSKLFLKYWIGKIHAAHIDPIHEMTMHEFKKYLTFCSS